MKLSSSPSTGPSRAVRTLAAFSVAFAEIMTPVHSAVADAAKPAPAAAAADARPDVVSAGPSALAARKEKLSQEMHGFDVAILGLAGHEVASTTPLSAGRAETLLGGEKQLRSSVGGTLLGNTEATRLLKLTGELQTKIGTATTAADLDWVDGAKAEVKAGINEAKIASVTGQNVIDAGCLLKRSSTAIDTAANRELTRIGSGRAITIWSEDRYHLALSEQAFLAGLTAKEPVCQPGAADSTPAMTGGEKRAEQDEPLTPAQQEAIERARIINEASALLAEVGRWAKDRSTTAPQGIVDDIKRFQGLLGLADGKLAKTTSIAQRAAITAEARQIAQELLARMHDLRAVVRASLAR